jgi:aminoglycoside/choline kinase family phosphotransferase
MPAEAADIRFQQASDWARKVLGESSLRIEPVSGDASFRRYFRVFLGGTARSLILMDAPPGQEDSRRYLDVDSRLRKAGLPAPEILHFDLDKGFGIIEDFGDRLYREIIDERSGPTILRDLFGLLERMATRVTSAALPAYDRRLLQAELDLFPDWYLEKHRKRPFSQSERQGWQSLCDALIASAQEQPQVFVHRDFHSCNLIVRDGRPPGIIDFQDAVRGPLSYDFISLVWDRYIHWPRPQLELWMAEVHAQFAPPFELGSWVRYCDLMGLQRNLKVVGIFARLRYRDNKEGYLEMIPMFYRYLLDVLPRYPEFEAMLNLLEDETCAP